MSRIYASFSDPSLAEKAAGALLDYGVRNEDVSLIRGGNDQDITEWQSRHTGMPSTYGTYSNYQSSMTENPASTYASDASMTNATMTPADDASLRAANYTSESEYTENRAAMDEETEDSKEDLAAKGGISTTTGADAGAGAAKGAGIGLGVGILAALAAIFVPGFGLVAGGGALALALGGAAATTGAGAVAGATTGYLKDQGVDAEVAVDYEKALLAGGALLEVSVPSNDVDEVTARQVLAKYGAANIGAYAINNSSDAYVS